MSRERVVSHLKKGISYQKLVPEYQEKTKSWSSHSNAWARVNSNLEVDFTNDEAFR